MAAKKCPECGGLVRAAVVEFSLSKMRAPSSGNLEVAADVACNPYCSLN
jgi:hypothetical protein